MAFINKLFKSNHRKNANTASHRFTQSADFPFNSDQVRVLLFRECDFRGRKLLFDSSAVHTQPTAAKPEEAKEAPTLPRKAPTKKTSPSAQVIETTAAGVTYLYGRPNDDYKELGELIWGAVTMTFRGNTLKIHWLKTPSRIACSQVFLSPISTKMFNGYSSNYGDNTGSDISSLDTTSINSFTISNDTYPLDVPFSMADPQENRLLACSAGDSGYTEHWSTSNSSIPHPYSFTTRSSFGSVYSDQDRKLSIDSSVPGDFNSGADVNHLQRRILRNVSTSFENRNSMSDFIGLIGDNFQTNGGSDGCVTKWRRNSEIIDNNRLSNPEMARRKASGETISIPFHGRSYYSNGNTKRAKLGIAVCVTLTSSQEEEMSIFFSEHSSLFESMLNRLRVMVENAYVNRTNFHQLMLRAWKSTSQWVNDLFTAPRIIYPIWLTLSSADNSSIHHSSLAKTFVSELCCLLSQADTKDSNFFMSTLLTAILTNHLGWVGSVAPINSSMPDSNPKTIVEEQKEKMSEISKSHPYNALWAQISDLYGAIGHPPKISKTIIVGKCHSTMDKILNILTYFIRCGEIKRSSNECVIHWELLDNIMKNMDDHVVKIDEKVETLNREFSPEKQLTPKEMKRSGLGRTMSHVKNLNDLVSNLEMVEIHEAQDHGVALSIEALTNNKAPDLVKILTKNVMNDIPNVLVYRDSRFVKQELRIGNHLMDTGIEMNSKFKKDVFSYRVKPQGIKFLVTSPDNEEFDVEEPIVKRILDKSKRIQSAPIDFVKPNRSLSDLITANSLGSAEEKTKLFWGMEPVKEGINLEMVHHIERGIEINEESRFDDDEDHTPKNVYAKSRFEKNSDHIRRSKIVRRKSGHNLSLFTSEESEDPKDENDVVFVLGDNEKLVGLKHSNSSLNEEEKPQEQVSGKKICNHKAKKHSGVKFNFEQYPQIVKNYMKNKNFQMTDSEFIEKALKMERAKTESTSTLLNFDTLKSSDDEDECEFCAGCKGSSLLQTPSNASELAGEYSINYPQNPGPSRSAPKPMEVTSVKNGATCLNLSQDNKEEGMKVVSLPIPRSVSVSHEKTLGTSPLEITTKSGMIPSLMAGISDHYIPDMVLQGVSANQNQWEATLRRDLTLASHCASIEQMPTENLAIVANIDSWEVRILSSNTYHMPANPPNGHGKCSDISCSSSVASMLETVQGMFNAGLSAYQCMSFIESKLQEFYLQSEVLASFLLATEFCSLEKVTTALNISDNDIPMLLSVASTHSPLVTKRYGVSFR